MDFSKVNQRLRQRDENGLFGTWPQAEAIFSAIESMVRLDSTKAEQRQALQLATIALRMPHGEKESVIKALLSLPRPMLE